MQGKKKRMKTEIYFMVLPCIFCINLNYFWCGPSIILDQNR